MTNFTLLTKNQVFDNPLKIFSRPDVKKYSSFTDFSVLLGGRVFVNDYNKIQLNRGFWWLKDFNSNSANCVQNMGKLDNLYIGDRICGVRPVVKFSEIKPYCSKIITNEGKVVEAEFGEYPQYAVPEETSSLLELEYTMDDIDVTGRVFTTDSHMFNNYKDEFIPRIHKEYSHFGNKYIRYEANTHFSRSLLRDSRNIEYGNTYWLEVSPVVWLVDEDDDIAISNDILFSGIQFDNCDKNLYDGNFDNTNVKKFLDNYFSKEIYYKSILKNDLEEEQSVNSFGFDLSKVNEEDIIKGAVESNISVFLHGKSSDGKSARVKALDPDCEIIYMKNATLDSLNGKSVYDSNTGSMIDIPPSWYTKVVYKCTKEPEKLHLVFFDELTNALPSMQGMAFNIILDREVNGKWKLPKNARIVAAGNDLEDSLAANKMAEPLFNRFAHVYINTEAEDWLEWALAEEDNRRLDNKLFESKEKIHPAILSYIESKYDKGINVLRTPFNGIKPNADPRKWEMASKVLYKTNKPEMLRALIGEELTNEFISFVKKSTDKVLTKGGMKR